MQIGMRLHDTISVSLEERLRLIKEQGFQCAHVALSKVINEFNVDNDALTPGLAMHLKRLFEKHEIDFAVLGCYLNLANPDPEQLRRITDTYKAHIRFAALLGAGVVGTETGAPNVNYQFEPACHGEEALRTFIRNLRPVVEYAEKLGVIVAIEPVRRHIVYNSGRARRVLDEIGSPNLQIIFDPVNMLDVDNYKQQAEVVQEAVELLGRDIAVIHMKDFRVEENSLISVAAGEGELDYQPVVKYIRRNKPFIHCTLEDTKPHNAVKAKEYIEDLYRKAE